MIQTNLESYPFLHPFINNIDSISKEYELASSELSELKFFFKNEEMPIVYSHFDYWVKESGFDKEEIGYDARGEKPVGAFPLFKKGFPINWYNVNEYFSLTYKLLSVPGIYFAQFSIMSPKSHILPHKHKVVGSQIFHINLFDLDGHAEFKAGKDTINIENKADYFMFDPTNTHESKNFSNSYRIHLMFDFRV
jgi:hypothetical protein